MAVDNLLTCLTTMFGKGELAKRLRNLTRPLAAIFSMTVSLEQERSGAVFSALWRESPVERLLMIPMGQLQAPGVRTHPKGPSSMCPLSVAATSAG